MTPNADDRPLVVACLRHTDQRPHVDPVSGAIVRDARSAGPSPAEWAALEHALRVAEVWSGNVLVVCAGPVAVESTLRQAAALGVAVLRVPWPQAPQEGRLAPAVGRDTEPLGTALQYIEDLALDERALAAALAEAIRSVGEPALVLCGDRSSDRGTGAMPAFLAHELGAAQALGLVHLRAEGDVLIGERRLDGGRREVLRVPRPAVCSVEGAGVRLRRASLPAVISATNTEVAVAPSHRSAAGMAVTVAVSGVRPYRPRTRVLPPPEGSTPRERLLELTGALGRHEPPTIIGPIEAAGAADALIGFLRRNGYLGDGAERGAVPRKSQDEAASPATDSTSTATAR